MTGRSAGGHVVIAGAGMAGLRAAERLRAAGWDGAVTVFGAEPHLPYNRPPLSKELLAGAVGAGGVREAHAATAFRRRANIDDVVWEPGARIVRACLAAGTVTLEDGREVGCDGLVVATGLRPRRLRAPGTHPARHVLRTVEDAVALRDRLRPGARAVVVGGGFVGCEVAATARGAGCEVTVVEPMPEPMGLVLGPELGRSLRRHHEERGVRFRVGRTVTELAPDAVVLDDGSEEPADLVVESIGSLPNVEWLDGNGLDLSDGVLCDGLLRAEGRPGVVAVGDVARFPNPRYDGVPRRVEHWCVPADTARRAAATLAAQLRGEDPAAAGDAPFAPVPSFWSDQFGLRVQSFGAPGLGDRCELVEGDLRRAASGIAMVYHRDGRPVGVVLAGIPASRHRPYRDLVAGAPAPV
ncbi:MULTISPECIES: NAD(P)/FAD-dependent oxidoreductase [Actinomadura]|uniref:NAD(P)/FAD-dependent oxidoreductase n=1 Tax=Actinomadura yumaensis TaxID=111807 RepID=A0ABW2CTY4_9ACTN|nr:FAD-dependent oxidoreductase [Actinomadura sp. J1-007]MWK39655.1 NAD(P)/FAD-dependent oxidoreductase [Actinomadura sp. J1-007]